jgi:hypothetical protein
MMQRILSFELFTCVLARSGYGMTTDWTIGVRTRQRQRIFPLVSLRPTQPPVQWVRGGVAFPGGKRGRGVTLTTYTHLVPRLRINRSPLPLGACTA